MSNPNNETWAEKGNRSENELFLAVGKALSHWELVEQAIASLFTVITVGSYFAPVAPTVRAYAAIVGSKARIDMVQAALLSWLHDWTDCPCGQNAKDVLRDCGRWASKRNNIAHGLVDMFIDEPGAWFLLPSLYNLKGRPLGDRAASKPAYRYNAEMIISYGEKFLELHNRLNEVTSMLGEWHRIAASERQVGRNKDNA